MATINAIMFIFAADCVLYNATDTKWRRKKRELDEILGPVRPLPTSAFDFITCFAMRILDRCA